MEFGDFSSDSFMAQLAKDEQEIQATQLVRCVHCEHIHVHVRVWIYIVRTVCIPSFKQAFINIFVLYSTYTWHFA